MRISLLWTCLVTNVRRDGSTSENDRFEYLLKSINSLSELEFVSVHTYIELGNEFSNREIDLDSALNFLSSSTIHKNNSRLASYHDWKIALSRIASDSPDLVLLLTYEDHALTEGGAGEFNRIASELKARECNHDGNHVISVLSHFPEAHVQADIWGIFGKVTRLNRFYDFPCVTPIGCLLVSPKLLLSWFANDFSNGHKLVSTENYFGPSVVDGECRSLLPVREVMLHIDGYEHVRINTTTRDIDSSLWENGIRLSGKSLTYQSLIRCGKKLTVLSYITFVLKQRAPLAALRLIIRSFMIYLLSWTFRRINSHIGFLWRSLESRPQLIHVFAVASSHGFFRFAGIEFKLWIVKIMRARGSRNV